MSRYVKEADRNVLDLSIRLKDHLPENSVAPLIDTFVDHFLNEKGVTRQDGKGEKDTGRFAYGPAPMLKLYLYGYLKRIPSSRRLEEATNCNVEVMYLLNDIRPHYHAIADFRKNNGELIRECFSYLRQLLLDKSMITLHTVAADGTKVKANASFKSVTELMRLLKISRNKLESYLITSRENDDKGDLAEELQRSEEERRQVEEECKRLQEEIDKIKAENGNGGYAHDPDARTMQHKDGSRKASYNVQTVTDAENHMIADTTVTTAANDKNILSEVIDKVTEETGIRPKEVLADSGYNQDDAVRKTEEKGSECYLPEVGNAQRATDSRNGISFKKAENEENAYICPSGRKLTYRRTVGKHGSDYKVYRVKASLCKDCPLRSKCTSSKHGRTIWVRKFTEWRHEFNAKMTTPEACAKIASRKGLIENVFGTLKTWMGKIPLLTTGRKHVQTEIDLYAMCYNLKRCMNVLRGDYALLFQKTGRIG